MTHCAEVYYDYVEDVDANLVSQPIQSPSSTADSRYLDLCDMPVGAGGTRDDNVVQTYFLQRVYREGHLDQPAMPNRPLCVDLLES
jgi:hypothetical protein